VTGWRKWEMIPRSGVLYRMHSLVAILGVLRRMSGGTVLPWAGFLCRGCIEMDGIGVDQRVWVLQSVRSSQGLDM
jgi:hypothetical protein